MTDILNIIRDKRILSWSTAICLGVLYFYGYQFARVVVRPLMQLIPRFYDGSLTGDQTATIILINVAETILASSIIGLIVAFFLCYIFTRKPLIFATASIAIFILLSVIGLVLNPIYVEYEWVTFVRIIRPGISGIILFLMVWLIEKIRQRLKID